MKRESKSMIPSNDVIRTVAIVLLLITGAIAVWKTIEWLNEPLEFTK